MRRILLFALLLLPQLLQAQEVFSRPIAEDHKRWVYQFFPTQIYCEEYFTDGDTIIGDYHAYRLYDYNYEPKGIKYMGAIYDEGRKTYIIDAKTTEPRILLDFDVTVGDTLLLRNQQVIVRKDTIGSIKGQFYRLLYLYNKTKSEANDGFDPSSGYWIEGVGSLAPNFCSSASWSAWHHVRLDQCYVDDELFFQLADLDSPTVEAIKGITNSIAPYDNSLYDLSGRKLPSLQGGVGGRLHKGVYIQGGKKFVVK